jgi:hypothetical protein
VLTLKGITTISVGVKGARGLVGDAYALRPGVIAVGPSLALNYVPLKAGEDTVVAVTVADLPANADVKSIVARLDVADDDPGAAPPPNDVTIQRDTEPATHLSVTPGIPTRPRNVTVRLDQGELIWTFADTLVKDRYDLPDFAEQANAYLDKASASGSGVTLKFLVKSDTPGRVKITITGKNVTRLQTQTWTNDLDQTVRLDRNLELNFGDRLAIPLDRIAGSTATLLTGVRLDVGGTFGAERLLGSVRQHAGDDYATVSADYAIAQQFVLETGLQASGISGLFSADDETELYLELQPDHGGVPGADAPLAQSHVTIGGGGEALASWAYAQFDAPASLTTGNPYWIVVKGVRGKARLGVEPAADTYLGAVLVNRTGRLWKPFAPARATPLVSMLRVVYVPGIDNQSAAVQIAIRNAEVQAVDPQQAARTLAFALGQASLVQAIVEITSHARGALTVANVIQEY